MTYPWQQAQWQQIDQLLTTERLPHAMLLHGNKGLGKANFANDLTASVLCQQPIANHQACGQCKSCLLLKAGTHPDLHYLEPTAAKTSKSKKPALSVRIDDVRELCEKLNQTSQLNGYRVAIINEADLLTISAANSLLKTLEEPGRSVLMILITSRTHRLPITIRSRSRMMRFTVPESSQSMNWLKEQQTSKTEKQLQQALKYAFGAPLAALALLDETEYQEVLSKAMTAAITGKNSLDFAPQLAKFAKVPLLEAMMSWASDLSKMQSCGQEAVIINEQFRSPLQVLAKKVNQQRVFKFHEQLNFNLLHSSIAVNEQLLWENLLLSWDNL